MNSNISTFVIPNSIVVRRSYPKSEIAMVKIGISNIASSIRFNPVLVKSFELVGVSIFFRGSKI